MNGLPINAGLLKRRKRSQRGVLMPELVLTIALLLMVTFAIIQYGVIMFNVNALNHVARETARYAAVHGGETTSDDAATDPVSIRAACERLCQVSPLNYNYILNTASTATPALVTPTTYTSRTYGNLVTITLQYKMSEVVFLKPLVPGLTAWGTYTVQSTTVEDIPQVQ